MPAGLNETSLGPRVDHVLLVMSLALGVNSMSRAFGRTRQHLRRRLRSMSAAGINTGRQPADRSRPVGDTQRRHIAYGGAFHGGDTTAPRDNAPNATPWAPPCTITENAYTRLMAERERKDVLQMIAAAPVPRLQGRPGDRLSAVGRLD